MYPGRITYRPRASALSMVEIVVSMVTLSVVVIGTSGYRYYSALCARDSDAQSQAGRVAVLLCEGWSGYRGSTTYDPVAAYGSDLAIVTSGSGPGAPTGYTILQNYKITLAGFTYFATLSWQNLAAGLKDLNVTVAWEQHGNSDQFTDTNKIFSINTYTIY